MLVAEIEPTAGEIDHVTAVLGVPVTADRNCCGGEVWFTATVAGVTVTVTTGTRVIDAVPVLVVAATLCAVTVMVCKLTIEAGMVYTPYEEIEPTWGEIDQVTA